MNDGCAWDDDIVVDDAIIGYEAAYRPRHRRDSGRVDDSLAQEIQRALLRLKRKQGGCGLGLS